MIPLREKEQGDAAFIEGRFSEACASYSAALDICPDNTAILLNRSLAALKSGNAEVALTDATRAAQLLASILPSESVPNASPLQMSKARFRQGLALMQLERAPEAVAIYKVCAKGCEKDSALQIEMSKAMKHCTLQWVAQQWARQIANAQQPILLSKRDGRLLKPVPSELRLKPEKLHLCLESALENEVLAAEARKLLCNAWGKGKRLGRGEVALMRAHAYLAASRPEQALKDARTALAYGPKEQEQSTWPHAHAAHSSALEGLKDLLMAALAMQRAVEQESDERQWLKERDRLLLLLPDQPATILQEEGSKGLESWLAAEKERALPEFKRKRPKYYYYYEWMKERIATHCGALPGPVLDKLLNIEAGELDTLLIYPTGVQAKAEQLLDVLEKHGPEYLETWRLPPLTWTELEELKASAGVPVIEASGTGKGKMVEGMTSLPIAAAAEDPEGVMFDDDDDDNDDDDDEEEDLDAVD